MTRSRSAVLALLAVGACKSDPGTPAPPPAGSALSPPSAVPAADRNVTIVNGHVMTGGDTRGDPVRGDGNVKTDVRTPAAFHAIELAGSETCTITIGAPASVELTWDANLLPLVTPRVDDGTLRFETRGSVSSAHSLQLRIQAPSLDALALQGASNVRVTGLHEALTASVAGGGDLALAGTVPSLAVTVDGAPHIDADALTATVAVVNLTGAPTLSLGPTTTLTVSGAGAGSVRYAGSPAVTQHVTGATTVSPR